MRKLFLAAAIAASYPAAATSIVPHLEYPLETLAVSDVADALRMVQSRYDDTETLVHRYTVTSLLGTHYNFVQTNAAGEPCNGAIVVSTDRDGQLYRIFNTLVDDPAGCEVNLPLPPRPHQLAEPPTGESATASMTVFDPDPRTATGQDLEAGHSNVDNMVIPAEAYKTVSGIEVTRHDGKLYLANSRVMAVDITEMTELGLGPTQGIISVNDGEDFSFTREQAAFRDVNAFFHLDHSLQYLTKLGFHGNKTLFTAPMKIDAQGQSGNNSTYLSDIGMLAMGVGGVPDSEDADVVLHEFGHAINEKLVPDWKAGDSAAMGEGFSDYWAGAYSFWVQRDRVEKFELDLFSNWDGITGALKSQRSLNDRDARYYPEFDYRAHVSVMGTLSDQLWSTPLFQTLKQAVDLYGESAFDEFNQIVLEGMAGMGYGAKMYDVARSTVDAAARLQPQKAYARLLVTQFKYHQIIRDDVVLAQSSALIRSRDGKTFTLPAAITNVSGKPLASYRAELSLPEAGWLQVVDKETVAAGAQDLLGTAINLPASLQCGAPLTLNAQIAVTRTEGQKPLSLEQEIRFIYGEPEFAIAPQQLNQPLADAREAPTGNKLLLGENLFALKVDQAAGVAGNDFSIYLSLEHARLSDLKVVVRAPSGRSITLTDYQMMPMAGYEHLYTLANIPELESWVGEPLSGNWTLDITDRVEGASGHIQSWGIGPVTKFQCSASSDSSGSKETTPPAKGSSGGSLGIYSLLAGLLLAGVRRKAKNNR
ncbi:proprotein convertase P-domain-containing protein [Photobacterium sp. SDRW27]|uniref:proprotein convertase P-domain-containing protein n=1 Tax=Photobacterium obscurum TaxID=2829490 RepID=UPI002244B066|nr:proprotein convertase P-domain-containing protein [Photobacterium obscurum]MCW8332169.1 proprotein convertase P-domain-containing protein [Photobacterium obscurum]